MMMVSIERLAGIGVVSGTGTVLAESLPLPNNFETWPATAIQRNETRVPRRTAPSWRPSRLSARVALEVTVQVSGMSRSGMFHTLIQQASGCDHDWWPSVRHVILAV